MNTDYMVQDIGLREKQYKKNINSKGNTRHYDDSCKTVNEYAREQNTVYDPMTNQILYGINSNMHVSGVSDGTCNQINPLLFTPQYMCGAGTAGGNRCVKDVLATDPYSSQKPTENLNENPNKKIKQKLKNKISSIENFDSQYNCNGINTTEFVVFLIIVFILIGLIYSKYNNINL
jgi:hypothetical protein